MCTHRCGALDHIAAGVLASLEPEELASALVLAQLRLVGQRLVVLAQQTWKTKVVVYFINNKRRLLLEKQTLVTYFYLD